jgi:uncharacterized membrane protein
VSSEPSSRRAYVDWARGLAVLLMIEAHTIDAWTRWPSRTGRPFAYAAILGGFAAPLFLWLAGIGVALSAGRMARRGTSRGAIVEAIVRRGLEIFLLAFLFRLQAFVISPGSYPVTLFRVDILNVMGPSIVASGILWGLFARSGSPVSPVVAFAGLASVCAMVTPVVRLSPMVDALPTWIQWYLRPAGDYTTFTLFPWAGFVFAGAGCGVILEQARVARTEHRVLTSFWIAGAALTALGFVTAARPSIYAQSSFWTSSPTYFAIRVGILMLGLAFLGVTASVMNAHGLRWPAMERLGRSSLFIYWIHVELVYGYATWPLRYRLPIWGVVIAFLLFAWLMYLATIARDRIVEGWRTRQLYSVRPVSG